ncbi:helix-turn-helix domain-containing protein [Zobellia laminariae]|uniref:helix-turn-helix domain-containing protein n=1 Tax=Zobellia laminariae TaxID=248906 RepID=UPI0012D8FF0F|nr:XRE family transcriptional regulator [Zobellia laminariae]
MKGGKYVKRLRHETGLTQAEMAEKLGKKPQRINEYEHDVYAIKLIDFLEMANKLKVKNFNKIFKN